MWNNTLALEGNMEPVTVIVMLTIPQLFVLLAGLAVELLDV